MLTGKAKGPTGKAKGLTGKAKGPTGKAKGRAYHVHQNLRILG